MMWVPFASISAVLSVITTIAAAVASVFHLYVTVRLPVPLSACNASEHNLVP